MSKERRTVSLDKDVDEYLSRPEVNASALVNELVSQHQDGGIGGDAVLRMREEQVESEVNHLKTRTEKKIEELEAIRDRRKTIEEHQKDELEAARDALDETPRDPENPAIKKWADDLGMTPAELLEEL